MALPSLRGLRVCLLLLALLAELPATVHAVRDHLATRRAAIETAAQQATGAAQRMVEAQRRGSEAWLETLSVLASHIDTLSAPATCTDFLRDTAKRHHQLRVIGVANAAGAVICTTATPAPASVGTNEWFARAARSRTFATSEIDSSPNTPDPILTLALPVVSADHSHGLRAVIYAQVQVPLPDPAQSGFTLPGGAVVSLCDLEADRSFAFEAGGPGWVEESAAARRVSCASGGASLDDQVSGTASMPIGGRTWKLVVTIPMAAVLEAADRQFLWHLAQVALVALAALLSVGVVAEIWILRDVRRLIAAARSIAGGDLSARAPRPLLKEIGTLSEAFNDMAANIERRADERNQMQTQHQQSQRMEAVGRLAGGVAHDFNNLITVIFGCVDEASDLSPSPDVRSELQQIRATADRAASLTHQLLAFSRTQELQPKIVDLGDTLTGMGRLLRRLIGEDIAIDILCATQLPQVRVDPHQLEQVVVNLAVNARDAMPAGGRLTLSTRATTFAEDRPNRGFSIPAGDYVELRVGDTGSGMSLEIQERIFEPFYSTKGDQGTGLGLATAYGIVKQSGGFILVDSATDRGTTFTMYFPIAGHVAAAVAEVPVCHAERPCDKTIMVVEDEDAVRTLIVAGLRRFGYHVIEAAGPASALELAGSIDRLDLMLADLMLPDMKGSAVANQVRKLWPHVVVSYMSGYADSEMVTRGILAPEDYFIQKPFTLKALASHLQTVLTWADPSSDPPAMARQIPAVV